ncbi:hypothetical protein K438DRAFT_2015295 [Mycena galopus ATCC 62051]|nr:hypothetical protein K438DRAFT_2015295 [Mycena galopus ATCC 62051]
MTSQIRIPALELPYELISSIFISCLPLRRRVRPHPTHVPLNLASTCSQWRAVALSTPELWTSVYLDFRTPGSGSESCETIISLGSPDAETVQDQTATLMDLWFTRAAGHPLSMSLICSTECCLSVSVLNTALTHFAQCGRIELAVSTAEFRAFNAVVGPFPSLESLSILVTDRSEDVSVADIKSVHHSLRLKVIRLMGQSFARALLPNLTSFPGNLTSLRISNSYETPFTAAHCATLIGHFPHLLHLDMACSFFSLPLFGPELAASLKTLLVRDDRALKLFTLPTLEHLGVCPNEPCSLAAFLTDSPCHLTTLSLTFQGRVSGPVLTGCLAALPDLITLHLTLGNGHGFSAVQCCRALGRVDLVHKLRMLIITTETPTPPYRDWVALLQLRPALVHAELHGWPTTAHESPLQRLAPAHWIYSSLRTHMKTSS